MVAQRGHGEIEEVEEFGERGERHHESCADRWRGASVRRIRACSEWFCHADSRDATRRNGASRRDHTTREGRARGGDK